MNKFAKSLLTALGGMTVLMLAVPADIAVAGAKFPASVDEIRRYCERIDGDFWRAKRTYGCGDKIVCTGRECRGPNIVAIRLRGGGDGGNDGGGEGGGGRQR